MMDSPREQTRKQELRDRRERIAAIVLASNSMPQMMGAELAAPRVRWALMLADELIRQIDAT